MNVIGRIEAGIDRWVSAARHRSGLFDHVWRAGVLYGEVLAGRLAAAIAYYGFFAVFALALVAFSIFGAILEDNDEVSAAAADFLKENLPFLDAEQIANSSGTVGVVGLVILVFTGIGWVEAIRSSQRLMYALNQQPGNLVVRRLVDLGVMIGVFVLLGVSVAAVDALESLLRFLLRSTGSVGLTTISAVLSVLVNTVLATALLLAVPRLRMSRSRLRPVVLLVAVGITLLNTVGRYYVVRTERNPAYTVVAGAVGLLLYLYLLNQLVLFGAALLATSTNGRVVDLAETPAPAEGCRRGHRPWYAGRCGLMTEGAQVLISVDPDSSVPPYEQVRVQLAELIGDGRLPVGNRLPTVRQLAADLRLAANTVARAYRELEAAGLLETRGRNGTFVAPGRDDAVDRLQRAAAGYAAEAARLGVPLDHRARPGPRRPGRCPPRLTGRRSTVGRAITEENGVGARVRGP